MTDFKIGDEVRLIGEEFKDFICYGKKGYILDFDHCDYFGKVATVQFGISESIITVPISFNNIELV